MPKDADFGPSPLGSFAKCVRASLPRLNYASLYLGTVVAHNQPAGSTLSTLDIVVDDPTVPSMQGVPLMNGLPGVVLKTLPVGAAVLVGWSESDPARPFCCTFGGGEHVGAMTLNADALTLGGDAGALPAARQTDPVTLTLLPSDILAIAAAMLATGVFTPSGSPPSAPPKTLPLSQQQIVSGSSVVKIK